MGRVKDHYKVLGVPRDETPGNIRRAFRRLAKEHHPDHAGDDGAERFREIAQAHDVLSDPASRQCHDAELRADDQSCANAPAAAASDRWRAPERWAGPGARPWRPGELIRDVAEPWGPPRPAPARGPGLELVLPAARAREGGSVRLVLDFEAPCPWCRGEGVGLGPWCPTCRACDGRGAVERRAELDVVLPAGLRDGDVLDLDAGRPLRVVVRVDRDLG